MVAWAEAMRIESVVIDMRIQDIRILKNELRWNEVVLSLENGVVPWKQSK